jgi:hypothetical protein
MHLWKDTHGYPFLLGNTVQLSSETPTHGEIGFPYTYTENRLIYFHAP